jgi:hypothetical protein
MVQRSRERIGDRLWPPTQGAVIKDARAKRTETLKDIEIRRALIDALRKYYSHDPDTLILQEFGLFEHRVRIDLAVVNGTMCGFEIKSDADTLERLPYQKEIYSRIFDGVIVVVGESQFRKIEDHVPEWWGIWVAQDTHDAVRFRVAREAEENRNVDPRALVRCLWKREAMDIIKARHLYERKLDKARREVLWNMLAASVPLCELKGLLFGYLKRREGWRIALPQESSGGSR